MYLTIPRIKKKKTKQKTQKKKKKEQWRECTGMKPSNWVAGTILPSLKTSLLITLLQVLQDDRADLAYSAFHGFGGFAIALENQQLMNRVECGSL